MNRKDDWIPGYVDPSIQIMREIERLKTASNERPQLDVRHQLDGLCMEMYRITGGSGR